jgi:ubiquinone/menaquinone biosynthesis C-methylase UbiE
MMETEKHKKRFNQGAKSYTTDRYPGRGQCMQKVLELLDPRQDDIVLDLGCGPGTQLIEISNIIRSGYGVDPAEKMILRAKAEIVGCANLKFCVGSAKHIPDVIFTAGINKIFSNYALHHLSDQDKDAAIKNLSELLPANGVLILGDLMFTDAPQKHRNLYNYVGYGPDSDTPAYVARLEQMFTFAGMKHTTYILNPLVGVIEGRKTQPSAARDAQKAARP